jgi:hypothetical protein
VDLREGQKQRVPTVDKIDVSRATIRIMRDSPNTSTHSFMPSKYSSFSGEPRLGGLLALTSSLLASLGGGGCLSDTGSSSMVSCRSGGGYLQPPNEHWSLGTITVKCKT